MIRISLIVALSLFALTAIAADTPEDVFWKSVKKTDVVEEYEIYLQQYPEGRYRSEADQRIEALRKYETLERLWERNRQQIDGQARYEDNKRLSQTGLIAGRYRDNGDGTVTDVANKLQWMRCSMGQMWNGSSCLGSATTLKWEEARQLRNNFAGHSDWKLPSIKQLLSLVHCSSQKPMLWNDSGEVCEGDYKRPTIEPTAFPNTLTSPYWSVTGTSFTMNEVFVVIFWQGYKSFVSSSERPYPLRLVRNVQ